MASPFSWPVLVPYALRAPAPVNLGVRPLMKSNEKNWEQHLAFYREADALYRAGNLKQAKSVFLKALSHAPGEVDTLWAIGSCFSELGQPHHAERYFRRSRAGASWKKRGDLCYNIANALLDQGRPRAAMRLYRKVPRSSEAFELARRNIHLVLRLLSKQNSLATMLQSGACPTFVDTRT